MKTPPIVSPQEWQEAWERMLVKEKELTRARDAMAAQRRRMPWMAVEKDYRFEGPDGPASLLDLFEGRRQLIVYRAFYAPDITTFAEGGSYPDRACVGCSFVADQVAHPAHLNARDTTLAFVSRAPQADIERPEGAQGLGADPVVHADRRLRCRLRSGRVARHERLHPRRGSGVSHLSSSTAVVTRRWAAPGTISTSPRSVARRRGRNRPRATPRPRPTSGGTITTRTGRARNQHGHRCRIRQRREQPAVAW